MNKEFLGQVLEAVLSLLEYEYEEYTEARRKWGDGNPHRWERLKDCVEKTNTLVNSLRDAVEQDAVVGWLPIETAPKDESVILLGYTPNPRIERRVYEGRWHDAQQTWTSVNGFLLHTGATHWMQLPTAPA